MGEPLRSPLVALVTDAKGNAVAGATVVWSITGGGASFPVGSTVTNSSGIASNTMTLGTVPAWDKAKATLPQTGTNVDFGANAVAQAPSHVAVSSGNNQTGTVGKPLRSPLVALVTDANGYPVAGATVVWSITGGGGSFPVGSTVTNSSGITSNTMTLGTALAWDKAKATLPQTGANVDFGANAVAGPPSKIATVSGDSQAGIVGEPLHSPFVALVTDSYGNAVRGATVAWTITAGGATFPVGSTVTNSSGLAVNTMTLGTVTAWDSATAGIATGAKVNFGAAAQAGFAQTIALYSGNQQTGTVGSPLPSDLEVICRDRYGNTSAMAQIAWTVVKGGGSFAYFQSATVQGVAVRSMTLGKAPGVNTAIATIEGTNTSYTFTETAVVGPPSLISIVSGNGQAGEPAAPLANPFYVRVTDEYGNPLSGVQVDWRALTTGDSFSTPSTITNSLGLADRILTMGPAYGQHNATATIHGTNISQTFVATHNFAATIQEVPAANANPAAMEPYFLGLSYPKPWIAMDMFDPNNAATVALFKDLGPGVLRFAAEDTAGAIPWNPTGQALTYGVVTTADIARVAAFVKATNWKVLYGIGFFKNTPASAASEAAVAAKEFGSNLLGFEIGNEPDAYGLARYGNPPAPQIPGYSWADFISTTTLYSNGVPMPSWPVYANAIRAAVPNAPLAGTSTGPPWAIDLAESDQASLVSQLTIHYYAGWPAESPTMKTLLTADPYIPEFLAQTNAAAAAGHVSGGVRYSECNSISGEVPGLTDSFGAALWTIDFLFANAFNQSRGVAFTSGGSGAGNYTPLVDDLSNVTGIGPDFYGLFAYSLISKGGTLMTTNVSPVSTTFSAYAVQQPDGSTDAILSNKDPDNGVTVAITPQGSISQATSLLLTAPSLTSTTGFTLGGSQINIDGSWTPTSNPTVPLVGNQAVVTIPPASAQIVHMQ